MTNLQAIVLGVVEGLTEFLPISSTGHLGLVMKLMQLRGETVKSFVVVIQFGAILAVFFHYRSLLFSFAKQSLLGKSKGLTFFALLSFSFLPTALFGFFFRSWLKQNLERSFVIASALLFGGVFMIVAEKYLDKKDKKESSGQMGLNADSLSYRKALGIGLAQCFALFPGTSRSMCTILAGRFFGLSLKAATEFSFLLGLPTLGAATFYEAFKERHRPSYLDLTHLSFGLFVSFVVALFVIRFFLRFIERYGLAPFGYYRIVLAVFVLYIDS